MGQEAPELRPLIMAPGLDVGAICYERPIMPAPGRAQGGWMNGARAVTGFGRNGRAERGRFCGGDHSFRQTKRKWWLVATTAGWVWVAS